MMKTKATNMGKVGQNSPVGATVGDTSRQRVGGQMPSTEALPTMADQFPWLTAQGNVQMPNPQDSATLPIFSPTTGNTDTGVGHSGDLGGAGA